MTSRLTQGGTDSRRVYAVIAAAGRGTRLGAELPKAFVPLRGRSLMERSVRAMITAAVVDEIIVVTSPDMAEYAAALLRKAGLPPVDAAAAADSGAARENGEANADRAHPEVPIRIVHGGGERADSVWCGLQSIAADDGVVIVHDSARALTPPGMIARVVRKVLDGSPAVVPVVPVADTIKRVATAPEGSGEAGEMVVDTPERATLRAVQTPQGFDLRLLREANRKYFSGPTVFTATDDASLMEWFGVPVACVQGDPMALKITTPLDLVLAQRVTDEAEPTIFEVPSERSR